MGSTSRLSPIPDYIWVSEKFIKVNWPANLLTIISSLLIFTTLAPLLIFFLVVPYPSIMVNFSTLATTFLPVFASLVVAAPRNWEHNPKTHHVVVGGPGKLLYTPQNIHANVGDTIRFTFKQKNHTLTQSSFEYPCQAIDHGFDSGLWVEKHAYDLLTITNRFSDA